MKTDKLIFGSLLTLLLAASGPVSPANAGEVAAPQAVATQSDGRIIVEPLFEYPAAPDELSSLQEKSEWVVNHFWDSMDFKNKKAVDQSALNHAFSVYVAPMRWASKDIALKSVDKLIANIKKNPALHIQFTKAAEENLYGPRAEIWIDEAYVKFLEAFIANKKIDKIRKVRYTDQLNQLKGTLIGNRAPGFEFKDREGAVKKYFPMSTPTIIEFGDPDCHECRMGKLKMEIDSKLPSLVKQGKVNILFIINDPEEGWEAKVADYPQQWAIGASENASDIYDIRRSPCFYVVDGDGKIVMKNVDVNEAIESVTALCQDK